MVFSKERHQTDDTSDKERMIQSLVDSIFSTKDMRLKSVLTPRQMVYLVRLETFADYFNSPLAKSIYVSLIQSAVSTAAKGGRGREDLVEALKALITQGPTEDAKTKSLLQKIFR